VSSIFKVRRDAMLVLAVRVASGAVKSIPASMKIRHFVPN
jgi:hypothetical protein